MLALGLPALGLPALGLPALALAVTANIGAGLASLPWLPGAGPATRATKADGMLVALRNPASSMITRHEPSPSSSIITLCRVSTTQRR